MHADRTNRTLLTLFGLLLAVVGAAAILAGTNLFGAGFGDRSLLANPAARYIGTHSNWFWPIAGAVALLLALLSLRWLIAVLRPIPRAGDIDIHAAAGTGRTGLDATALRDALTTEVSGYRGVESTRVRVFGTAADPRLAVFVRAERDADMATLLHRLETQALAHARQALDAPDLRIRLDLSVGDSGKGRVA